jgi:hypothetical protein
LELQIRTAPVYAPGLPDPLVLNFYLSVSGERIVQLIIVHNKLA